MTADIDDLRLLTLRELTRQEEADWNMGPIGPRDEIGCIVDGDHLVYVDGQGNPLEPGWVLSVLRGGPRTEITPREARQHPWMPQRNVVIARVSRKGPTDD